MSPTIATRSAVEFWGFIKPIPKNLHSAERDCYTGEWKITTWEEVFERRKNRQEAALDFKRTYGTIEWKPCLVWVFYNHQRFPYHGFYCYIRTINNEYSVNFRPNDKDLQGKLMQIFTFPGQMSYINDFYGWMETFAKHYPKPSKKKKINAFAAAHCCIKNGNIIDIKI